MTDLKSIFSSLVYYFKWETVYITQDIEQYAKIKAILRNNNIMVRTKFIEYKTTSTFSFRASVEYKIQVKPEDANNASRIIESLKLKR